MAQALKVLVTGPVTSLAAYSSKLAQLQQKHSFSLVLAQDLFSRLDDASEIDKLVSGEYKLPVQVYATYGRGQLPPKVQDKVDKGEEVCPNLNVLRESSPASGPGSLQYLADEKGARPIPQPRPACSRSRPDFGLQLSPALVPMPPLRPPPPSPPRRPNRLPRAKLRM